MAIQVKIQQIRTDKYKIDDLQRYYVDTTQIKQQVQIGEARQVDVDRLKIPYWVKNRIKDGWEKDSIFKSRSECDLSVMCDMIKYKIDDDTIYSIFVDPRYKISAKALEKGKNAAKYITHTIGKAKQLREEQKTEWERKIEKFSDFNEVINVYKKWLHIEDEDYIKVLHASLISHRFDDKPLWLLLVAPPSGTKTVVLQPLSVLKDIYNINFISEITAKTFVSGDKKYKGLLDEMQNGVLLFKDFTTVLQLDANTRSEILQQLREIWDGNYVKVWGTGKRVEWNGKITFLAGTTEFYEAFRQIDQTLGERYLLYKPFIENRNQMTKKAFSQIGKERTMSSEIQEAILRYHQKIEIPKNLDTINIPDNIMNKLCYLTDYITRARSSVKRNYRAEIEYVPQPEAPTRLAKQLICLGKALTIINKNPEITEEEYRIMAKTGVMTIAGDRYKIIKYLYDNKDGSPVSTSLLSELTKMPRTSLMRVMENLVSFDIADQSEYKEGQMYFWTLTENIIKLIEGAEI
jgi:hypothetical protein